jgi:hypothetical protein
MDMKKVFLPLFVVLFVGLMKADETSAINAESIDETSTIVASPNIKSIMEDCRQLLGLQQESSKSDLMQALMTEMQLNPRLQSRFILEYQRCELGISCDQLPKAFAEYKESVVKVQKLAEKRAQTKEHEQFMELMLKK